MALPVSAGAIRKLLGDVAASGRGEHVLAIGGSTEHAPLLRQQFLRGRAEPEAVRLGGPEGADVYVHVVAGETRDEEITALRRARRAHVPAIAVAVGLAADETIPYVLATDVVWVADGAVLPLERVAEAVAVRLGEHGAPLAARVPLLRGPVSERLVASFAWKNGVLAAASWVPGADLPFLALNELRLVLRLAQANGAAEDVRDRLPELAATLGAAYGLRALARELVDRVRCTDWALKVAFAYAGTRALGEAARLRFELAPRRPLGGVERAWP
jgi:hypothetical protein